MSKQLSILDLNQDNITIETAIAMLTINAFGNSQEQQIKNLKLIELISKEKIYHETYYSKEYRTINEIFDKILNHFEFISRYHNHFIYSQTQYLVKHKDTLNAEFYVSLKDKTQKNIDEYSKNSKTLMLLKDNAIISSGILNDYYTNRFNLMFKTQSITQKRYCDFKTKIDKHITNENDYGLSLTQK